VPAEPQAANTRAMVAIGATMERCMCRKVDRLLVVRGMIERGLG
jgi:hypothetical protein